MKVTVGLLAAATLLSCICSQAAAQPLCIGDCRGEGNVTVDEIVTLANIAQGEADTSTCADGIPSGSSVDVALIIQAVTNALNGCPPPPTIVWDGGGDGVSWGVPLNWSPNRVPGPSDDVGINVAATPTIVFDAGAGSVAVKTLTTHQTLRVTGGSLSVTTFMRVSADLTITGGQVAAGTLDLAQGTVTVNDGAHVTADALEIRSGTTFVLNTPATFGAVQVDSGGVMTHAAGGPDFTLTVVRDLVIDAGGAINADGKGYGSASGPGAGQSGGGGGGYGATGGGPGGVAYGSPTAPNDLGSGGGNTDYFSGVYWYTLYGGTGGGRLRLDIGGHLSVNGRISVNGQDGSHACAYWGECWYAGGGSGGTILIRVDTIAGTGTISAAGGYGGWGGGGGGRIALYYKSYLFDAGKYNVNGGSANGGLGTLYSEESGG